MVKWYKSRTKKVSLMVKTISEKRYLSKGPSPTEPSQLFSLSGMIRDVGRLRSL